MTDKEIIKALECCKKDDCDNCPNNFGNCYANLAGYALDLIKRQQAEIEKYEKENHEKFNKWLLLDKRTKERYAELYEVAKGVVRAEAIKEFAERLKALNKTRLILWDEHIDTLVKEMTGETKPAETDFPSDYTYGY